MTPRENWEDDTLLCVGGNEEAHVFSDVCYVALAVHVTLHRDKFLYNKTN